MFEYVSRSEYQPVRNYVESVIKKVQNEFRNRGILTFRFYLIGSAGKRHLITREVGGNKGFDLDYNFEIQKYNPKYHDPRTLKLLFMEAFNKYFNNGYDSCEDSTSVFTIKKIDQKQSKIIHSFDFAIVENVYDNEDRLRQRYIRSVKINDKINRPLKEELIIVLMGPIFQIIYYYFLKILGVEDILIFNLIVLLSITIF